jgi:hypothetical protein
VLKILDLSAADEDDTESVFYELLLLIERAVEHDINDASITLALIRALAEMALEPDVH